MMALFTFTILYEYHIPYAFILRQFLPIIHGGEFSTAHMYCRPAQKNVEMEEKKVCALKRFT